MSSGIVICRLCAESKHNYKQVDLECDMLKRDEVIKNLARLNATIDFNDIRLPSTVCLDCICFLNKCSDFLYSVESSQKVLHDIFYQRTSTQVSLSDDAIFFERAGLDDCDFLTESESDFSNESQDAITPNTGEDIISLGDSVRNHPDSSVGSDGPVVISLQEATQTTQKEAHSDHITLRGLLNNPNSSIASESIEPTPNIEAGYDNRTSAKVLRLNILNSNNVSDEPIEVITSGTEDQSDAIISVKSLESNDQPNNTCDSELTKDATPVKQLGLNDFSPNSSSNDEPITSHKKTDAVTPVKNLRPNSSDDEPITATTNTKTIDVNPVKKLGLDDFNPDSSNDESSLVISFNAETKSDDKIPEKDLALNDFDHNSNSDDEPILLISSNAKTKPNDKITEKNLAPDYLDISGSSDNEPIISSRIKSRSNAASPFKRSRSDYSDTDSSDTVKKKRLVNSIPIDELNETWESYNWLCHFCETIFPTIAELKSHSMEVHSRCNPYRCKQCKIRKQSLKPFLKHLRSHMQKLKLSCFQCPAMFEDLLSAQKHTRTHSKQLSCPGCYTTFKNSKELKSHQDIYFKLKYIKKNKNPLMKNDRLTCKVCDKTFTTTNALRKHLPLHMGRKHDHVCEICGKKYFEKNHLTYHMETHRDERPFKCKICNRGFKRMNILKEHVWIHNDKPFPCDKCNKTFKRKKSLKLHSAIHSDILPYECTICKKCFRLKTTLTRHKRVHTDERPFACPACKETFRYKSNLNDHAKNIHGIITSKGVNPLIVGTKDNIGWKKQMMKRKLPERT